MCVRWWWVSLLCWIHLRLHLCVCECVAIIITFGRCFMFCFHSSTFCFVWLFVGIKIRHNSTANENQCNSFKVFIVLYMRWCNWGFSLIFSFYFNFCFSIRFPRWNGSPSRNFLLFGRNLWSRTWQTGFSFKEATTLHNWYNTIVACDIFPITMLQLQEKKNLEKIQTKWEKRLIKGRRLKDLSLSQFQCCRRSKK